MPYSQKYTPLHCFFCNFAGWVEGFFSVDILLLFLFYKINNNYLSRILLREYELAKYIVSQQTYFEASLDSVDRSLSETSSSKLIMSSKSGKNLRMKDGYSKVNLTKKGVKMSLKTLFLISRFTTPQTALFFYDF